MKKEIQIDYSISNILCCRANRYIYEDLIDYLYHNLPNVSKQLLRTHVILDNYDNSIIYIDREGNIEFNILIEYGKRFFKNS